MGQGGKATLATALDADILKEIICLLTRHVRAGKATFLVKVKSHRGEPINERADTLAEEGRGLPDDDKRWDDRTDRMTLKYGKGTRWYAQCGRTVYATPSENNWGGPSCKSSESNSSKALDRKSVVSSQPTLDAGIKGSSTLHIGWGLCDRLCPVLVCRGRYGVL